MTRTPRRMLLAAVMFALPAEAQEIADGPSGREVLGTSVPVDGTLGARWACFESQALTVITVPAAESETGVPERALQRRGALLDEEALDALGLLEADPTIVAAAPTPSGPRRYWWLSLGTVLGFPAYGLLVGAVTGVLVPTLVGGVLGVGVGVFMGWVFYGAAAPSPGNRAQSAILYAGVYSVILAIYGAFFFGWLAFPGAVLGGLVGAVGAAAMVGSAAWWGLGQTPTPPTHPYARVMERENTRLLAECGLRRAAVGSRFFSLEE